MANMCGNVSIQITGKDGQGKCNLTTDATEWQFSRVLNEPSRAEIETNDRCLDCINSIDPWCDEVRITIDNELVWIGPVIDLDLADSTITAIDRSAQLQRRVFSAANTTTAAISTALDGWLATADGIGATGIALNRLDELNTTISVGLNKADRVFDAFDNLAGSTIWWTMIGNQLVVGDQQNLIAGSNYRDVDFTQQPDMTIDAEVIANEVFIRYNNNEACVSYPPGGYQGDECTGPLQITLEFKEIVNAADALALAETYYNALRVPRAKVVADDDIGLLIARVDCTQLNPGLQDTVTTQGVTQQLQLSEVTVSGTGNGVDSIEAEWSSGQDVTNNLPRNV